MSAWMFDHGGMDRVVTALRRFESETGRTEEQFTAKSDTTLGNRLFRMNAAALVALYQGRHPATPPRGYEFQRSNAPDVQLFKSLRCFLYQCSEGDVPDSPLYAAVDRACDWYAATLGCLPGDRWSDPQRAREYSHADWG